MDFRVLRTRTWKAPWDFVYGLGPSHGRGRGRDVAGRRSPPVHLAPLQGKPCFRRQSPPSLFYRFRCALVSRLVVAACSTAFKPLSPRALSTTETTPPLRTSARARRRRRTFTSIFTSCSQASPPRCGVRVPRCGGKSARIRTAASPWRSPRANYQSRARSSSRGPSSRRSSSCTSRNRRT